MKITKPVKSIIITATIVGSGLAAFGVAHAATDILDNTPDEPVSTVTPSVTPTPSLTPSPTPETTPVASPAVQENQPESPVPVVTPTPITPSPAPVPVASDEWKYGDPMVVTEKRNTWCFANTITETYPVDCKTGERLDK